MPLSASRAPSRVAAVLAVLALVPPFASAMADEVAVPDALVCRVTQAGFREAKVFSTPFDGERVELGSYRGAGWVGSYSFSAWFAPETGLLRLQAKGPLGLGDFVSAPLVVGGPRVVAFSREPVTVSPCTDPYSQGMLCDDNRNVMVSCGIEAADAGE